MRIGTAEDNSTFLSQGQAIAKLCAEAGIGEPVEAIVSPLASTQNATRLAAGEIAFGFMASNWIGRARAGEAPFTEKIDLRMVAPMNVGPLYFITRSESSLRTVRDLQGRRVSVGLAQSGMTQHAHVIFGVLGLSFANFEAHHLDFKHGGDALLAGSVDAQFQCPIPNPIMTALDSAADLRVLEHDPADLEKILAAVPFYRRARMKAGALRALKADSFQPGVVNVLVSHTMVPERTVQVLTEAIVTGAGRLGVLNGLFDGLGELFAPLRTQGAAALEFGGVRLHDGAIAAYRKLGLIN